jgi:3-oxoacyl-[acyl-carrier protein] reductase
MDKPITLITGTRKGIGRALVEHYTKKGHVVIGCSRFDIDWEIDNYQHLLSDISDSDQVQTLFCYIKRKYGRLNNLINNAGIASMNHMLLTPVETLESIFGTNVIGLFLMCREAAKIMSKNRYGRIVNFSTVATPLKLEGESVYAASKAAVVSLTQILAKELAEFNITVNAVGPTPVETDLIRSVSKEKINNLISLQSVKRMGETKDITNVIDFFLSRDSDFITGQCVYLGGV